MVNPQTFCKDLRMWQNQQTPMLRALSAPMVGLATRTVDQLQARIAEQDLELTRLKEESADAYWSLTDQVTELDRRYSVAETALEEQREMLLSNHREYEVSNQVLQDRINVLERKIFGKKSERRKPQDDGVKKAKKRRRKELTAEEKEERRKAAAAARAKELEVLRSIRHEIKLPEGTPELWRNLPPLESVIYEWHPGELVRVLVIREQCVTQTREIVTAPPPPQVIEGGLYGPALHAKVVVDKCLSALPFHRQVSAFRRIGVPIAVSVVCSLFHRSADRVEAIYKVMMSQIADTRHLSADETPQPVLDEGGVRKGWMWIFASEDILFYAYSRSRGGKIPLAIVGRTDGTMVADAYTGYNLITGEGGRARAGCWSHARRGIFNARAYSEIVLDKMLSQIDDLFYIEQQAIASEIVGTDSHLALRQELSKPLVESILATAESEVLRFDKRSSIAKALQYIINQGNPLSLFLTEPFVPIHNNLSERALRIIAILRKNSLFVGHDEGGRSLAMLMTMMATCQMHGVNPERWLEDVLIRVSERGSTVEELLPWNWKTGRGLYVSKVFDTR